MHTMRRLTILVTSIILQTACGGSGPANSDPGPADTPILNISDISVEESDSGQTTLLLNASLDKPASNIVTFNYATADSTASSGTDYIAISGIATIDLGQSLTAISIPILGDSVVELDEFFTIDISSATNATIEQASADITIRDNDETTTPALLNRPANPNCQIPNAPVNDIQLTQMFNITFDAPILMLQAPGNNDRWYVVEQDGLIKTFLTNDSSSTIFADLTDRAVYSGGQDERGLLGMAFHPNFQTNNQVFLYYINNSNGLKTIVSRYTSPR